MMAIVLCIGVRKKVPTKKTGLYNFELNIPKVTFFNAPACPCYSCNANNLFIAVCSKATIRTTEIRIIAKHCSGFVFLLSGNSG